MTPDDATTEIVTALQAAGCWPEMREEQEQVRGVIRDVQHRVLAGVAVFDLDQLFNEIVRLSRHRSPNIDRPGEGRH